MAKPIFIPRPATKSLSPEERDSLFNQSRATDICRVALELARERDEKLKLLKDAILKGDTDQVYRIGADLCGIGEIYGAFEARNRAS